MTIMKKLLMISALVVGMQPIAHAYYDTASWKTEIEQILDYAQTLYKEMGPEAKKAAKCLEKIVAADKGSYRFSTSNDILILARIVNSEATVDVKTTKILNIKAKKDAQYAKDKTIERCGIAAFCIAYGSLFALILMHCPKK